MMNVAVPVRPINVLASRNRETFHDVTHQRGVVDRARDFLASRIESNPSLDEIGRAVGVNKFLLLRYFRRQLGTTPHAYLIQVRLEQARSFLSRGLSPADVAAVVGFADQSHLTRLFKRAIGLTPGQYSKQVRRLLRSQSGVAQASDSDVGTTSSALAPCGRIRGPDS
jgi:AraC-like DNA-binding protein